MFIKLHGEVKPELYMKFVTNIITKKIDKIFLLGNVGKCRK